jgi:hypothetical protein
MKRKNSIFPLKFLKVFSGIEFFNTLNKRIICIRLVVVIKRINPRNKYMIILSMFSLLTPYNKVIKAVIKEDRLPRVYRAISTL